MGTSRIAFIVVCMEPGARTREPQAIVVGTAEPWTQVLPNGQTYDWAEGMDWRYAFFGLTDLQRKLKSADTNLFKWDKNSVKAINELLLQTSKQKNGTLSDMERKGLDDAIFKPEFLKTKLVGTTPPLAAGTTVLQTALVARNIERAFFFSWNNAQTRVAPLASFDTARPVDQAATMLAAPMPHPFSATLPVPEGRVGSRLVLFPDLSDPARPGALTALALQLQFKVAVNAHWVEDDQHNQHDRHDTRMLFELSVKAIDEKGKRKPMWAVPASGERGMRFDRMDLSCTLEPFADAEAARSEPLRIDNSDILQFAYDSRTLVFDDPKREGVAWYMPLLAAHGITARKDAATEIVRTFGLRALAATSAEGKTSITRIGWRFELALSPGYVARGFFEHASLQQIYPLAGAVEKELRFEAIQFAQEQRLEDIGVHLEAQRVARTIVTVRFGNQRKASNLDKDITRLVLARLDGGVERVHAGLKAARDGGPLSLLPRLHSVTLPVPWQLIGTLLDPTPGVRALRNSAGVLAGAAPLIRFTTLAPCAQYNLWDRGERPNLKGSARATLPRLVTESRSFPCYAVELGAATASDGAAVDPARCAGWPAFQSAVTEGEPDGVTAGVRISVTAVELLGTVARGQAMDAEPKPGAQPALVQAMRFSFASRASGNTGVELNDHILFWPAIADQADDSGPQGDEPTMSIEAVMRLPIDHIEAAAEDDLPAAARAARPAGASDPARRLPDADAPLLLPMGDRGGAAGTVNLSLTAVEQVGPNRSHAIALSVRASEEKRADGDATATAGAAVRTRRRVLIIEPSPFRIAAVEYDPIDGLGTRENNEVAVWNQSGEGGESWRVRDDKQIVDLIYQPQALGEAMEKNRADLPNAAQDILPGMPSAARFGTMTMLKVDPTYNDTAYREPGWNLRRILGYPTQRSPGARVLDLRLELLYGLLTRVRSDNLWITEIGGAIGAPPAPLPDKVTDGGPLERHLARMRAVLAAEQRRLAVDKLWRDRADQDLRLTEGLSYQLRHKRPGEPGGPATPLRWPVSGTIPTDSASLIDPDLLKATFSTSQDDRASFPGGLAWAFESANILMRVYGKPDSDSGSLRGAYLTALGGFGSQRALFDERKSIIESETTLGRVQRYRLERIGRIACLWHRAKHVIVYERTVVPAAQFFNKPPIGLRQDEHLGRAIPRKVDEYVEILTPVRRYPEDGTSLQEAAFFVGAEFKSIKIRVDSAWGSDVRREGWKVPLWNTAFLGAQGDTANPDDPAFIYPKPQISLLLAGDDGKPVPHELADPEKLYFYTSVIKNEDDNTDLWQTVRGVDFSDMPLPQLAGSRTESADLTDAMLPPASPVVPGYETFTLTLVPSREQVALTHGRIAGGPLTTLRNVTVARAAPMPSTAAEPVQQFGRELAAKAANVRAELDLRVGRILAELEKAEGSGAALKESAARIIEQASARLAAGELAKAIGASGKLVINLPKLNPVCDSIKAKVRAQVAGQLNRIMIVAGDMVKSGALELNSGVSQVASVANTEINRVNTMLDLARDSAARLRAAADIDARKDAITAAKAAAQQIRSTLDQLKQHAADAVKAQATALDQHILALPSALRRQVLDWRNRTRADLGAVTQLVSGGVADAAGKLVTPLQAATKAATAFQHQLDADGNKLTAAVRTAAQDIARQLEGHRNTLRAEVAKIDNASLPAEARRLLQVIDKAVAAMLSGARAVELVADGLDLTSLRAAIDQAVKGLTDLGTSVEQRFSSGATAVEALGRKLESLLDDAVAALEGPAGLAGQVEAQAGAWRLALADSRTAALAALDTLADVDAPLADLQTRLAAALPPQPIPAPLLAAATQLGDALAASTDALRDGVAGLGALMERARATVLEQTSVILTRLEARALALDLAIEEPLAALLNILSGTCAAVDGFANALIEATGSAAGDLVNQWLGDSLDIAGYEAAFKKSINEAIAAGEAGINDIKAAAASAAARFTEQAEASARQLAGSLQESLRDITGGASLEELARRADGIYQQGDSTLRALSALGNPPKTSNGIDYNRSDVRFVMAAANKLGIDMTPTLALVNRAADQVAAVENAGRAVGELLGSFGVRLPCSNIGESLIPDSLKGLSVANFFPDIAGIDMQGLLKEVGFPDLDDMKAIKFRHRVDQASMRVYMDADIDVPFAKPAALMRFGPVEIIIDTARFTAASHMEAGLDGTQSSMNGKIFGDWRIVSGGQTILTFRQTGLYFDDSGKIDFRIQPERIELADALKFITDLMGATGQKGGLRIEPFVRGGIPSGVAATLDMVLPPIQTGAFGISDLSLHVMFGLAAVPAFEIVSEMSIGMRTAPFTLNVWILNGGGYLMQRLSYLPSARPQALMTYTLEVGVVVGLGLGFSFGVVSGGVWVQIGCSLAFTWANQGTTTTVRVFLLVRGNVDVCGLITASISLLFEISYDGARIIGAGTLTVRAKISMFYTLEVDQHVEYVFAGEKQKQEDEDYAAAYC